MLAMLAEENHKAQTGGFTGFRTAGDLSWVKGGKSLAEVLHFESKVDQALLQHPFRGLCQYPISRFSPAMVEKVFSVHKLMLRDLPHDGKKYSFSVRRDDLFAQLVADRLDPSSAVYYTVHRLGSREILAMGSEKSFENALSAAEVQLQLL